MKTAASGRFSIGRKLGAGSFGEIHRGDDRDSGDQVAIKLEKSNSRVPQLSYESKLYNIFKNGCNIPKFYWFGTEGNYNVMVIQLLGKSLEDLAGQFPHHRLSLKTVLMLVDQMISSVEYIHKMNFIHRDIKPDNFVMGTGSTANQVFIIDYGLSKKYRDPCTHKHIRYVENKDLTGTARYASVNAMRGIEQSRRDDLEALGFVWLYLLRGDLPWMGLDGNNRKQKYARICRVKEQTTFESLCAGFPEEFVRYFYEIRQIRFTEEPDYAHLRKMFRKLFMKLGFFYDYVYDWSKPENKEKIEIGNAKNKLAENLSEKGKRLNPKFPTITQNLNKTKSKRGAKDTINNLKGELTNLRLSTMPQKSKNSVFVENQSRDLGKSPKGTPKYSKKGSGENVENQQSKRPRNSTPGANQKLGKSDADIIKIRLPPPEIDFSYSSSLEEVLPSPKRLENNNNSRRHLLLSSSSSSSSEIQIRPQKVRPRPTAHVKSNDVPSSRMNNRNISKWKSETMKCTKINIPKLPSKDSLDYDYDNSQNQDKGKGRKNHQHIKKSPKISEEYIDAHVQSYFKSKRSPRSPRSPKSPRHISDKEYSQDYDKSRKKKNNSSSQEHSNESKEYSSNPKNKSKNNERTITNSPYKSKHSRDQQQNGKRHSSDGSKGNDNYDQGKYNTFTSPIPFSNIIEDSSLSSDHSYDKKKSKKSAHFQQNTTHQNKKTVQIERKNNNSMNRLSGNVPSLRTITKMLEEIPNKYTNRNQTDIINPKRKAIPEIDYSSSSSNEKYVKKRKESRAKNGRKNQSFRNLTDIGIIDKIPIGKEDFKNRKIKNGRVDDENQQITGSISQKDFNKTNSRQNYVDAKRKLANQQRNSLKLNRSVPNWMNERFKSRM